MMILLNCATPQRIRDNPYRICREIHDSLNNLSRNSITVQVLIDVLNAHSDIHAPDVIYRVDNHFRLTFALKPEQELFGLDNIVAILLKLLEALFMIVTWVLQISPPFSNICHIALLMQRRV